MSDDIKSLDNVLGDARKGWPTRDALKKEWVYCDSKYIEQIEKLITEKRICLINGAEGRGKTVLARLVGFKRYKDNWDVFVIETPESRGNIDSICATICSIDKIKGKKRLFIIENAHISDEIASKLVETVDKSQKASFIFTARKIFYDETSVDDIANPFEVWIENGWYVDLNPDLNTIHKIIEKFILEKNITYSLSSEDETWLKDEFGSKMPNLRRLRFYLEVWNSKPNVPLSSIKKEDILEDVYKNYINPLEPDLRDMLVKVAAVFQFDVNFSGKNFERNLLGKLCDSGVITFLPGYFYRLQHSTDAAYIVEAEAVLSAKKKPDDFTSEILKEYLLTKPENYFGLLKAVQRNDKKDILSTIFENNDVCEILLGMVKQDSLKALSTVIGCFIWSCGEEKGLEFWEQYKRSYGTSPEKQKKELQKKLNKATLPEILWYLLFFLKKLDIKERDWLLNEVLGEDRTIQALGERSRDVGLATVRTFLQLARQAGVDKDRLNAFCEGLDFKALGERSRDVGLATVENFLKLARQAGVGSEKLNAFCEGLEFKALGERSKDIGLATVMTFLKLARQAGVGSEKLNAFCEGLEFKALGERSKDIGLATVMTFLKLARQAGVDKDRLKSFCESLNWKKLGENTGKKIDESKSSFFELHSVQRYSFISKDMALQFVEGIGWGRLNKAINEQFSPDILAVATKLLINKCGLKRNELMQKGLDLNPYMIWFNAFISNPCHKVETSRQSIQQYYLNYAGTCFVEFVENELSNRSAEMFSLKSWNILIHNISVTCPAEYLEKTIIPLLEGLPATKLEKLISESDLSNIAIFLSHFNPKDGVFKWSMPLEIDFKRIDFLNKIKDSMLEAISHFLFNFYFINRGDCSHYFAEELDKEHANLISKITDASIAELDFFFWNLWMAMPKGKKPCLFENKRIMDVILNKLTKEKKDKESILGLMGTLNMSMFSVDERLKNLLDAKTAKAICEKAVKEGSIKFIRLLGGCLVLLPKDDLVEIYKEIQETNFQFNVQVPNQIKALSIIENALK